VVSLPKLQRLSISSTWVEAIPEDPVPAPSTPTKGHPLRVMNRVY
jgi:hypothetical protein